MNSILLTEFIKTKQSIITNSTQIKRISCRLIESSVKLVMPHADLPGSRLQDENGSPVWPAIHEQTAI